MNFLDLVKKRQSTRAYAETPVDRKKIEHCLEAARLAPSACNSQPWHFVVVDEPELKNKVALETFGKIISFNSFSLQAPALVVVVTDKPKLFARLGALVKKLPYYFVDIGIATEHFCLQAEEEGLGTCMLGWFNERSIKKILNIPKKHKIVLVITVGYPDSEETRKKTRKSLDDIHSYNEYSK
jgi:nitroreductase